MSKVSPTAKMKAGLPKAYTWRRLTTGEYRRCAVTTRRFFKRLGSKRMRKASKQALKEASKQALKEATDV